MQRWMTRALGGSGAPLRWTTKGQWLQMTMTSVAEAPFATSSRDTSFPVRGSGSCACTQTVLS